MKKLLLFPLIGVYTLISCNNQDAVIETSYPNNGIEPTILSDNDKVQTYALSSDDIEYYYYAGIPVYIYATMDNTSYYYIASKESKPSSITVKGTTFHVTEFGRFRILPEDAPDKHKHRAIHMYYSPSENRYRLTYYPPEWVYLIATSNDYIHEGLLGYTLKFGYESSNTDCLEERFNWVLERQTGKKTLLTTCGSQMPPTSWTIYNNVGVVFKPR